MSKEKKTYKSYYVPKVLEPRSVYELEMENEDGTVSIWKYDKKKNPNGPYQTTTKYPPGYEHFPNVEMPKSKQRYLNPKTGKEVSYARARNLGLV
jgi:hypothetical protein|tara:strand:- start:287 stop:571 length:285 start_codon:yes stop_codon:yes gene_type:complete